jgi:PRTRC genetic system protein B
MAHFTTDLGDSRTFAASKAILLYTEGRGNSSDSTGFATVHDIEGRTIKPGRAMGTDELRDALAQLDSRPDAATVFPPHVLTATTGLLAWWRPAAPATLWFSVRDGHGKATRSHPLNRLSGSKFPMPPLVFVVSGSHLRVFAMKQDTHPDAKTPLIASPFWNVNSSGTVCTGSMKLPALPTVNDLAKIEQAFFQSNFTHNNYHGRNGNASGPHKGKHEALWLTARRKKRFPIHLLHPEPISTLGKILNVTGE